MHIVTMRHVLLFVFTQKKAAGSGVHLHCINSRICLVHTTAFQKEFNFSEKSKQQSFTLHE